MNDGVSSVKIMLVDDDDSVRDAISEILSRKGWRVNDFSSAERALADLRSDNYDVVLADINMPGLSGIDFLQMAKQTAPDVPVVMITGYPTIDRAVEAMKIGAVDFLPKPFKAEELEIAVRKAANEAHVIRAHRASMPAIDHRAIGSMPEIARKRLEDKIRDLSILHTISETIDEASDKERIFRKTMDLAQIIMGAEKAFIMVVEENNGELVVRASSGYDSDSVEGLRFSSDAEPFKSVIKNRCYSYMVAEDDGLSPLVADNRDGRKSILLAPMLMNREVVVVLGLAGKDEQSGFSNDSVALLLNLTAKASLKLENIALYDNIFGSIIAALNSLINALDARDTYTKDHSKRVTAYAVKIAETLGCAQDVIDSISFAGPLHDIGKIAVRDEVLLKRGVFTEEEKQIMKTHVVRGEEILRPLNLLTSEKAVVLYHHERWDGEGYPNRLKGNDIPLAARIFSVADTFDAMTSSRPYRTALSFEVSMEEIVRCGGTQFDPAVVEAFLASGILNIGRG